MDATHEATGKTVYIKEVPTDGEELRIAQLVTQEEWIDDPRNHCVPVANVFKDHKDPEISYMVMPFLRPVDTPPFEYVKEIISFTDQILEVTVNHLPTSVTNASTLRDWYSSTKKEWRTGTAYVPELCQPNDLYPQRLCPEEPHDGC